MPVEEFAWVKCVVICLFNYLTRLFKSVNWALISLISCHLCEARAHLLLLRAFRYFRLLSCFDKQWNENEEKTEQEELIYCIFINDVFWRLFGVIETLEDDEFPFESCETIFMKRIYNFFTYKLSINWIFFNKPGKCWLRLFNRLWNSVYLRLASVWLLSAVTLTTHSLLEIINKKVWEIMLQIHRM